MGREDVCREIWTWFELKKRIGLCSLYRNENRSGNLGLRKQSTLLDMYELFTFEPLNNLHLALLNMVTETVVVYSSSNTALTSVGYSKNEAKPLIQVQNAVRRWYDVYTTAVQMDGRDIILWEEFSRDDMSSEMNGKSLVRCGKLLE